jgi:hypothetical protein
VKRIYHTWDKWECYPAGFYGDKPPAGMTAGGAVVAYAEFLKDTTKFRAALERVTSEWVNSCEHYLSNEKMNRIAWLGQASACIALGLPAGFRSGFNLLSDEEKAIANQTALDALNEWLQRYGEPALTMEEAASRTEVDLY